MSELPPSLFRNWVHSFEDDTEGVTVYRPADYPFPPARGRRGLEFAPDGTFIDHPVGRGDAPDAVPGQWRLAEDRRLAVSFPENDRPDRGLEILRCDEDVLEIRSAPA
ncbi:hypothetical protein J7I98_37145 [Streptomyces sp. ISL-98]|uniref:hypothetical protein n=1 Tax=Streptomyces sp. ISL-98 TaxID=2819192 RepID=UPI001BECAAF1|nr:hypothetical protein [Streptomyces sp. ISL-98]MBT2511348.1 hypothetical protein [Streptomyces sp. ISL-98]